MLFTQPEFKKKYYLLRTQKIISHDILDVYINNLKRIESAKNNTAYLLTIYMKDKEDNKFFEQFDEDARQLLLTYSNTWFNIELSQDDLNIMYRPTICHQTKSLQVILTDNTKIFINNKSHELSDVIKKLQDVSFLRKCSINMQVQHNGLYIYSKMTSNKWEIKSLNIYQEDDMYADEKEDIEESWDEIIHECNEILDNKIQTITKTKESMNSLYQTILAEKNKKIWEEKIGQLKNIIQNIIF